MLTYWTFAIFLAISLMNVFIAHYLREISSLLLVIARYTKCSCEKCKSETESENNF